MLKHNWAPMNHTLSTSSPFPVIIPWWWCRIIQCRKPWSCLHKTIPSRTVYFHIVDFKVVKSNGYWIQGSLHLRLLNPRIVEIKVVQSKGYWIQYWWIQGLLNPRIVKHDIVELMVCLNPRLLVPYFTARKVAP